MSVLQHESAENRSGERRRLLKGGIIAFSGRHATLPCMVRDISDSGARLRVGDVSAVPDTFELIVELDGLEVDCEVTRRGHNEIGVKFISEPNYVAPQRAQIIGGSTAVRPKAKLQRKELSSKPVTPIDADFERPVQESSAVERAQEANSFSVPLLIADDDPDDRLLISEAFNESQFDHQIDFVENGEDLLKYLRQEEPFQDRMLPGLILLDLNMPIMDGRTALMHIKTDPTLKRIPVIALTTSNAEEDIQRTYELGVSAFISKPSTDEGLTELVRSLNDHWMRFVALPAAGTTR